MISLVIVVNIKLLGKAAGKLSSSASEFSADGDYFIHKINSFCIHIISQFFRSVKGFFILFG